MERRSKERIPPLEIYTDGSLKKQGQNMTFGGWCFYVIRNDNCIYAKVDSMPNTTNQRMELQAVVEALKYAQSARRKNEKVIVYSDSAYIINCYEKEWYIAWEYNGWLTSRGESVKNQDLWHEIVPFFDDFWYDFRKVKGHDKCFWNLQCDEMAQAAAEKLKKNWRGYNEQRSL